MSTISENEWTLETAWRNRQGCSQSKPSAKNVLDENVTEFDEYLAEVAIEAAKEPDPKKRAKMMHCAVQYGLPFLNDLPYLEGTVEEVHAQMKKKIAESYDYICFATGERPKKRVLNAIENFDFRKLTGEDWWDIWDGLGQCGTDSHEMRKFREFALVGWAIPHKARF